MYSNEYNATKEQRSTGSGLPFFYKSGLLGSMGSAQLQQVVNLKAPVLNTGSS
jgi:hypothetical protein